METQIKTLNNGNLNFNTVCHHFLIHVKIHTHELNNLFSKHSMDGVKVALGNRGMTVEAARQCAKDRKAWRALVHM